MAEAAHDGEAKVLGGLTLARYAEARATLRHLATEGEPRGLARLGLERAQWEAANAAWRRAIEEDAEGGLVVAFASAFTETQRRLAEGALVEAKALSAEPPPPAKPTFAQLQAAPPAAVAPPQLQLPPVKRAPAHLLATGGVDFQRISTAVLPFAKGNASAEPEPSGRRAPSSPPVNPALRGTALAMPSPAGRAALPFEPAPQLTLEQYASLTAELLISPERAQEIRTRYQVGSERASQALALSFRARFDAEPETKARFDALVSQYRAWLQQKKGG